MEYFTNKNTRTEAENLKLIRLFCWITLYWRFIILRGIFSNKKLKRILSCNTKHFQYDCIKGEIAE